MGLMWMQIELFCGRNWLEFIVGGECCGVLEEILIWSNFLVRSWGQVVIRGYAKFF
jgi:hypothetical protein